MKRELTHEEAFVVLDAAVLDALDAAERDAVLTHAAGCGECTAELESLRATVAQLAFVAAATADSASRQRVRARLLARAAAGAAATEATAAAGAPVVDTPVFNGPVLDTPVVARAWEESTTRRKTPGNSRQFQPMQHLGDLPGGHSKLNRARFLNVLAWKRAEWVALAASILMVVSIGVLAAVMKDRSNVQDALKAQLAVGEAAISATDSLRLAGAAKDSLIAGLTGRDVAVMSLTSSGANAPYARMFWDQKRNTWTLVAHNMPELKPGRTYQLWLVTATEKISAGTFDPRNGEALVRATYALPPASLRALAVTEEPAGGVPQPTGAMVIAVTAH
jgi:hypothetical protein